MTSVYTEQRLLELTLKHDRQATATRETEKNVAACMRVNNLMLTYDVRQAEGTDTGHISSRRLHLPETEKKTY